MSWSHLGDRVCFIILTIFFLNNAIESGQNFLNQIRLPLIGSILFTLASYALEHFKQFGPKFIVDQDRSVASFGNVNMLTQGLNLQLVLFTLTSNWNRKHIIQTLGLLAAISLVATMGMARSALIFQILFQLILSTMLLGNSKSARLFLLPMIILFFGLYRYLQNDNYFDPGSRTQLIQDTFHLIQEFPLGVGPGNFPFNILPFQQMTQNGIHEFILVKSPHNEFLRFVAEDGFFYALLIYFFFINLFLKNRSTFTTDKSKSLFFWSMLLLFTIETLLQFPFENPLPFVGLALFSSLLLSHQGTLRVKLNKISLVTFILFFIVALTSFSRLYNRLGNRLFTENKRLDRFLCRASVEFWPTCIRRSKQLEHDGSIDPAIEAIQSGLLLQNNNYFLFREWIILQFKKDNIKKACHAFHIYNSLFENHRSSLTQPLGKTCGDTSSERTPTNPWNNYLNFVRERILIP